MKRLLAVALILSACGRGSAGDDGSQGPQGPVGDDAASAPRIDSISPAIASKRNTVLVLGTNFSADAADLEVRIGGFITSILEATPTSLRLVPPPDLDVGPAPVTVTRGAKSSASVGFTLAPSGVDLEAPVSIVRRPGEALELADGRVLVPDRDGAIREIATTGVVRTLVTGNGLVEPVRLLLRGDGKVLVFDAQATAFFRLDPMTGALAVEGFGISYLGGSFDAAGNLYLVPAGGSAFVDRIDPAGVRTSGWGQLPSGTTGVDLQVVGTDVFVAVEGSTPGVVKLDAGVGGLGVLLPSVGVNAMRGISANAGTLVVCGDFDATNGVGIATIDGTTGVLTAVTTDATPFSTIRGAYRENGGAYVIADEAGWVARRAGTAIDVLSGIGDGIEHLVPVASGAWAVADIGAGRPGWITELAADGTTRVVARGRFGQLAPGDAGKLLVTRPDASDIAEIDIATGAVTQEFSVATQVTAPEGYARDAGGFQYVSGNGVVAKYDAAGVVVAGFSVTLPGASQLRVDGAYLYVTSPATGSLDRVYLVDGSIAPVFDGSAGVVAPSATFRDLGAQGDSFLYVTDPVGGWIYYIDGDGHGSVAPHVPLAAGALYQRADGMLVAGGAFGLRLITP